VAKFWSTVETKVKSAAFASLAASLLIALLNALVGNSQLLGGLPPWLQFVIVTIGPTVITFLAGYRANHTSIPPVPTLRAAKRPL
jgi:hypothetical protein